MAAISASGSGSAVSSKVALGASTLYLRLARGSSATEIFPVAACDLTTQKPLFMHGARCTVHMCTLAAYANKHAQVCWVGGGQKRTHAIQADEDANG